MGDRMNRRISFVALLLALFLPVRARADVYYVTVSGLAGDADYQRRFDSSVTELDKLLKAAGPAVHVFTLAGDAATRDRFDDAMGQVAKAARPEDDFVLILVGHGSYDGVEYKFNLVGPDISAAELARLFNAVQSRRQLVVNTTSSSGGGLAALQRKGRAVIAATKSDAEKNETVSALEAFQYAERKTADFYTSQKRLATEHPVFDDTGTGEPVRESGNGQGRLLASFALVHLG